jgi:hypothetical protein
VLSHRSNCATGNGADGVVLLGGFPMPAASKEADGSSRHQRIARAILLLDEALQIIDDLEDLPELGARLHGLIDELKNESTT